MEILRFEIERLIYPPSFQVNVLSRQNTVSSFVKIHFKISDSEQERDSIFMTLPLKVSSPRGKSFIYNVYHEILPLCKQQL